MKHCISAARAYAELEAASPVPPGREFHIVITRPGAPAESYVKRFTGNLEADLDAIRIAGEGAAIAVRPVIEATYGEGLCAYPQALNDLASTEARAGWLVAQLKAQRNAMDLRGLAIVQQRREVEGVLWA